LFGVVALVILWVLKQGNRSPEVNPLYFKSWIMAFLFGIVTECIQALTPYRHFRLGDIYTDALGAAVFLFFTYSLQNRLRPRHFIIMRNVLLLLVMIRGYPIFTLSVDTWDMEKDFPVLSSFESPFEMTRYSGKGSTLNRIRLHATEGKYSLKADLNAGLYPGISMDSLHNDWRGYTTLNFDVFLEGTTPLDITVRINDRKHNEEYEDRFNKVFHIFPGKNHILINLDEVKTAPKGRYYEHLYLCI
jgi:VanZ family protein